MGTSKANVAGVLALVAAFVFLFALILNGCQRSEPPIEEHDGTGYRAHTRAECDC